MSQTNLVDFFFFIKCRYPWCKIICWCRSFTWWQLTHSKMGQWMDRIHLTHYFLSFPKTQVMHHRGNISMSLLFSSRIFDKKQWNATCNCERIFANLASLLHSTTCLFFRVQSLNPYYHYETKNTIFRSSLYSLPTAMNCLFHGAIWCFWCMLKKSTNKQTCITIFCSDF